MLLRILGIGVRHVRCTSVVLLAFVGLSLIAFDALGWDVRQNRASRNAILKQRLQKMLHNDPFSKYALAYLLRMHKTQVSKAHLLQYYRRRVKAGRADALSASVVLGRLLLAMRDWKGAHGVFVRVMEKRPAWHRAQLALLQAMVGLGQYTKAMDSLLNILPKVKGGARRTLLRKFLQVVSKKRDVTRRKRLLAVIQKEPWYGAQRAWIARLLSKHGGFDDALPIFQALLKERQGGRRVRWLIEISRAALRNEKGKVALRYLKKARAIPALHRWYAWEMQMLEVAIYRQMKALPALLKMLSKRWKKSTHSPSLLLLGRLHVELKQHRRAERVLLRVLRKEPDLRTPRLILLGIYKRFGQREREFFHLRELVKYKVAMPNHMFSLARRALSLSGLPYLQRWDSQKHKDGACQHLTFSKMRTGLLYSLFGRGSYNRRRDRLLSRLRLHFCSREEWQRHRQARWRLLKGRVDATTQRKRVAEALRWTRLSIKRFPRNWSAILALEGLLEAHGLYAHLRPFHKALEKALSVDLEELSTMRDILTQRGEPGAFFAFLKRLSARRHRTAHVMTLAEFMLSPYIPKANAPDGDERLDELRRWEQRVCPLIRPMIVKSLRRDSGGAYQVRRLQLLLLAEHCGAKERWLIDELRQRRRAVLLTSDGSLQLASYALLYRLPKPLSWLLQKSPWRNDSASLVRLLKSAIPTDVVPSQLSFLHRILRKHERFDVEAKMLLYGCQKSRTLCVAARRALNRLPTMRSSAPEAQIRALSYAVKWKLNQTPRSVWLSAMIKHYWNHPHAMQALAESKALFGKSLSWEWQHMRCMDRVLALRSGAPLNVLFWRELIVKKIQLFWYRRRYRKSAQRDPKYMVLLDQMERRAMRFPTLYRSVLAYYAFKRYRYRKRFLKQLQYWMSHHADANDLFSMQVWGLGLPPSKRFAVLKKLSTRLRSYGDLYALARFAQLSNALELQLQTMARMLALRPNDPSLLKWYVSLLDRLQGREGKAHRLAVRWLVITKYKVALSDLQNLTNRCCLDSLEQRWALRRLMVSIPHHSWKSLWPLWKQLRPKLSPKVAQSAREVVSAVVHKYSKPGQAKSLAAFAYMLGAHGATVRLLSPMAKRNALTQPQLRQLALSLDMVGQLARGDRVWKRYFAHENAPDRATFFRSLVHRLVREHRRSRRMLFVALLRQKRGRKIVDRVKERDRIAALQRAGQHTKAIAHWYWLLGERASACLSILGAQKSPKQPQLAHHVLSLKLPYFGPIMMFPKCSWRIPSQTATEQLKPLAAYMKRNPNFKIKLQASASRLEPDAAFLAQQRRQFVRRILLANGIPFHRVEMAAMPMVKGCRKKGDAACEDFSRQVTVLPVRTNKKVQRALAPLLQFAHVRRADFDKDGIIDLFDRCPLPTSSVGIRYRRRRYGRYYRRRLLLRRTGPTHPLNKLYPLYYRVNRSIQSLTQPASGCQGRPAHPAFVFVKQEGWLQPQGVMFSKSYSYLNSFARKVMRQVAGLRQFLPYLGTIQVEVLIREKRRYGYGRLRLRLARQRLARLKRSLAAELRNDKSIKWVTVPPDMLVPMKQQPLVRFRLVSIGSFFSKRPGKTAKPLFSPTLGDGK